MNVLVVDIQKSARGLFRAKVSCKDKVIFITPRGYRTVKEALEDIWALEGAVLTFAKGSENA